MGPTIVFCIPGNSFSGNFLRCWTEILVFCFKHNIRPVLSRHYSCNIYFVRNMCLGADVSRGKNQKPFDGKINYDYILWIDSDIVFSPEHLIKLLNHDTDIVSGLYLMEGGKNFATVKDWDTDFFAKNGYFQFLSPADVEKATGLVEVAYTGMGFMLVKKGVFESMEYPWFEPRKHEINGIVDYSMEDVSFCLRAGEMGFKVFVDPKVRVGHEKSTVLV